MNIYFIVAAIILFIISLIHSIQGERRLIKPLLNSKLGSSLDGSNFQWRPIIRGWHLTTFMQWSIAVIIIDLARVPKPSLLSVHAIAIPFAILGVFRIIASRCKHVSGLLLVIALLLWAGLYFK